MRNFLGYRESVKRLHAKYWGRKKPTFKQNPLLHSPLIFFTAYLYVGPHRLAPNGRIDQPTWPDLDYLSVSYMS